MSGDTPAVTAVVACRNEVRSIESCVRSLLEQDVPEGGFELIVVDGMSEDGTRDILQKLAQDDSRLRVIDNPQRITPTALNAGIRNARGRYVAFMSAHARYPKDYLRQSMDIAERLHTDNVGGAAIAESSGYVQRAIAAAHHSPFSVGGASWHSTQYEGRAGTVFGGFYRRDVFERIGMFDEEMVRNQDDELNFRLELAGGLIWQSPAIRSWYQPRSTLGGLFRQYWQYGYWKVRVMQKHGRTPSLRHYVPAAFVLGLGLPTLVAVGAAVAAAAFHSAVLAALAVVAAILAAAGLVAYLVVLAIASITTAAASGWSLLPILPVTFACYHVSYGVGFLQGLVDFGLRRRLTPPVSMSRLTR
ncbi:MAG TPA: glycosyltransferase family 2 protein [Candidatus Dormibacteraeota bacterium]|nr:glycosyltransferase family 2 protein [Candidatus Dormibacteraeota bacterium]